MRIALFEKRGPGLKRVLKKVGSAWKDSLSG
jgi:hypothetical protein